MLSKRIALSSYVFNGIENCFQTNDFIKWKYRKNEKQLRAHKICRYKNSFILCDKNCKILIGENYFKLRKFSHDNEKGIEKKEKKIMFSITIEKILVMRCSYSTSL